MRRLALRWPLHGFKADAALALALAVVALALLVASDTDATLLALVTTLLLTVPLAWRRRSPLPAVLLVYLGMALLPSDADTFVLLPALAIAFFSAAAELDRRDAALTFAAGLVAIAVQELQSEVASDVAGFLENFFFVVTVFGAISIAGRLVRRDRLRAAELEALTVELEREREERARLAVAEERVRIARELHDVVAHGVSVMVVQAGAHQGYVREGPDKAEAALESIRQAGMQALAELRRMLGLLRSSDHEPAVVPQPGIGQAAALVEHARRGGLNVDLSVDGDVRPLPPGIDLAAYRVVQEALTNVVKHAGGAPTRVGVRYLPQALEVEVTNEAPANGAPPAVGGAGHGQIGMRERVALYGGELDLGPDPDGGYHVHARLPLGDGPP